MPPNFHYTGTQEEQPRFHLVRVRPSGEIA